MKINNLTNGLVVTLLLASPIVGAETEYPAADFKPKVIYQDMDSSKSAPTPAKQVAAVESTESDSKYPAADFAPKVLYKDADYKPSKSSVASSERTVSNDAAAVSSAGTIKAEDQSSMSYLIGLVVLAVAGYLFFTKREPKAKVYDTQVYSKHVSGLSGVARYLRRNNMVAATGVARYLESHQDATTKSSAVATSSVSSVERYLEKQAESAKAKAAQPSTGVEKYMRNRG